MLVLSDVVVRQRAHVWRIIKANERAFLDLHNGDALIPPRIILEFPGMQGASLFKPGSFKNSRLFGQKVINVRPGNAARGLGTTPAVIMLFEKETGATECIMNATYLTALRTAAGSAVATARVTNPKVRRLVIFGAGLQAEAHVKTMCCVRDFTNVILINRNISRAEALATQLESDLQNMPRDKSNKTLGDLGKVPQIQAVASEDLSAVEAACRDADVICTTTGSSTPVFEGSWLKDGAHVNAVGSYLPENAELDIMTVQRCKRLIVDTAEAWDSGDLRNALLQKVTSKENALTLGTLLNMEPLTYSVKQGISLFKSVGSAVQDIASALQVYEDIQELHGDAADSIQQVEL